MTFLSATPDTVFPSAASAVPRRPLRALAGRGIALGLACAILTTPGAVAQAKWFKLSLIVTTMQHRSMSGSV